MGNELTPEQLEQFRSNLAGPTSDQMRGPGAAPVAAPPAAEPSAFASKMGSLDRLASNPAVQTLAYPLLTLPRAAAGIAKYGTEKALDATFGARKTTPFADDGSTTVSAPGAVRGGPPPLQLNPLPAGPELTLPNTPTLAQMRGPTAASGGYGGGGINPLTGLAASYKQAQLNQFGTLDEKRDLVERRGELQGERIDATAHLQELDAARKQRDAEVMAEHQAQVQQKHDAFLARNQELADQIGEQKIDPSRLFASKGIGEKIALTIAGALSGAAGQGPQFMQRMDGMIDTDVKAQMANVDNLKAKLGARQTLFGQMMAESGDRRVAETQTKQLMWEAAKQQMAANAERLGIPEVMNNSQLMQNQIVDERINPLRVQMTGSALQAAQQQAAAAAAAQRAAEEKAWNRGIEVAKLGQEADKLGLERDKFNAENGKDDAGGVGKAGRQAMALDAAKTQQELDANLKAVSDAQKDVGAISAGGSLGNTVAGLPAWVPGVTGARKDVNAREAYNALVRPGVGAAWKMRTGGVEPKNPTILEEQAKAFTVLPSDNEETVRDRMALFKKHMTDSAAAQGAKGPVLPGAVKFDK